MITVKIKICIFLEFVNSHFLIDSEMGKVVLGFLCDRHSLCLGKESCTLVCFRDRASVRVWVTVRVGPRKGARGCAFRDRARVRTRVRVRVRVYHSRIVSDLVKVELEFV